MLAPARLFIRLTQPRHCSLSPVHHNLLHWQTASASAMKAEPVHCRLSTVQNADEVLVMENGTIVERGTHSELLDKGELARCCYYRQSITIGSTYCCRCKA